MFPLLFEIPIFGGIRIYTYGVLVATAFVTGLLWTVHEAKKEGISSEKILDLGFYVILAALVGSRILYIIIEWKKYLAQPLDIFKIWEGGLVFYGGLLGAILASFIYVKKQKLSFLRMADLFSPGIAIGHAIGRLGCFAAGCCYGRVDPHSHFAIIYPPNRFSLAPPGVPLLPSQLFESLATLIIFGILLFIRRRKSFTGQVFLIYLMLYSVSRAFLETLRGQSVQGFIIPGVLSTSQLISLVLILIVGIVYFKKMSHLLILLVAPALLFGGCNKAILHSKDRPMEPVTKTFKAPLHDVHKTLREVLVNQGYKIEREDESTGKLVTGWQSTKATSHYVDLFDKRDYGTVGAYFRLEIELWDKEGNTEVRLSAPVRSVVGRIKSSHEEEKRLLKKVADLLRPEDFEMTNVGTQE